METNDIFLAAINLVDCVFPIFAFCLMLEAPGCGQQGLEKVDSPISALTGERRLQGSRIKDQSASSSLSQLLNGG